MPDTDGTDRFVFVDLETMGLDPVEDPIIEMGFRIVDSETLRTIDDYQIQIWDSPYFDKKWDAASDFVKEMHTKSGIWTPDTGPFSNTGSFTPADALPEVMTFLAGYGVSNEPMCGSSVQFDRSMLHEQYPDIEGLFSYRNIDISTLKELCRRMNPDVYSRLEEVAPAKKRHRVLDDLDDTIEEFRFYTQEFLIW